MLRKRDHLRRLVNGCQQHLEASTDKELCRGDAVEIIPPARNDASINAPFISIPIEGN